jgi:hypothetical protein
MQQETSGDYGYDLAHDDVQPSRRADAGRPDAPARPERAAPAKRSGPADPAGDLEYDEAHDF